MSSPPPSCPPFPHLVLPFPIPSFLLLCSLVCVDSNTQSGRVVKNGKARENSSREWCQVDVGGQAHSWFDWFSISLSPMSATFECFTTSGNSRLRKQLRSTAFKPGPCLPMSLTWWIPPGLPHFLPLFHFFVLFSMQIEEQKKKKKKMGWPQNEAQFWLAKQLQHVHCHLISGGLLLPIFWLWNVQQNMHKRECDIIALDLPWLQSPTHQVFSLPPEHLEEGDGLCIIGVDSEVEQLRLNLSAV